MPDMDSKITKVLISRQKKQLIVLVKEPVTEKLKQQIIRKFKEKKDIQLEIKAVKDFTRADDFFNNNWNFLRDLCSQYFPSCSSWLSNCQYQVEGRKVTLFFDTEIAVYTLRNKNFPAFARKLVNIVTGMDVDIKLLWKTDARDGQKDASGQCRKICEQEMIEVQRILSRNRSKGDSPEGSKEDKIILGRGFKGAPQPLNEVTQEAGTVIIEGDIFDIEEKDIQSERLAKIISLYITDYRDSIIVRVFVDKNRVHEMEKTLKIGNRVRVRGEVQYNKYLRESVIAARDIIAIKKLNRQDTAPEKRIELHAHTRFSAMDGVTPAEEIIKKASEWGHKAIAITDHGVVQAFPEAHEAAKKTGIKVIYGVEGYLVNDRIPQVYWGDGPCTLGQDIVVFDIETTGLDPVKDRITEIGAVKIHRGQVVDRFNCLVNPGVPIPPKITGLTGITDSMVKDCPMIDEVLPRFLEFAGGSLLAAHNAPFDMGFIKSKARELGLSIGNPVLDTLNLCRIIYPGLKSYRLNILAKHLGIKLEKHHRASDDAMAAARILLKCNRKLWDMGIKDYREVNDLSRKNLDVSGLKAYHVIVLAKNKRGLENLYKIISRSHLEYFYKTPRIPKSLLSEMREGLIIGSACEAGEVFRAILEGKDKREIMELASFYDYLEIQPTGNNYFLIENGTVKGVEDLQHINKEIYRIGKKLDIPVVATGDVHFLEPQDEVFRRIIMAGKGFDDADNQAPLYLRTTDEMLEEFKYLGEEEAREVVIENPLKIGKQVEEIVPIPEETYPPKIPGADQELREMTLKKAVEMYGDPLPDIVKGRLDKELNAIIDNGYAVMYIIAQRLVSKSIQDGYLVGSRGSVGSSLVATMSGITEVNPLPPHYLCKSCKYSEFILDGSVGAGVDLSDKDCPRCSQPLEKLGFDIPFEVFMGFDGDKEPDIDLNFSGEYQSRAHKFTEELFGKDHVYRAGTIATLADKTAYGFVKNYLEKRGITVHSAEVKRLVKGCTGIKRTTGQHPGAVMIVPKDMEIYQFTPVQKPADDPSANVVTTHFDYHAISGRLLKLDILGHDDPTVLKMLYDLTGIDPMDVPLDDKRTMALFSSTSPLGISGEDIDCPVGSLGIPEFGTRFVRQMLVDTKPTTFAELVRISGLSHGTDVWLNNAQDLILKGIATLKEVISTRDDIMIYLIQKGLEPKLAFKIMEKVRKGKGVNQEEIRAMEEVGTPKWFIESCQKIKYMFPKAHAVAYVTMAFRIAYYKVYYPLAFYATYFTVRADEFNAQLITGGREAVDKAIRDLEKKGNGMTQKDKSLLTILEVAREMYCRGFGFLRVDIYKSHQREFKIADKNLLPPLKSLQGLGDSAAQNIVKARERGPFISVEDLRERARLSRAVVDILREHGCLDGLPETNQISLF